VDGLERDGLLMRRADPADRRATLLDLTPQARLDFERAHAASRAFLGEAFSPLSAAERKEFLRLLMKMRGGPIGKAPAGLASDPCRPSE
jgi:DNA-binding MarR family transcriptional regulator